MRNSSSCTVRAREDFFNNVIVLWFYLFFRAKSMGCLVGNTGSRLGLLQLVLSDLRRARTTRYLFFYISFKFNSDCEISFEFSSVEIFLTEQFSRRVPRRSKTPTLQSKSPLRTARRIELARHNRKEK